MCSVVTVWSLLVWFVGPVVAFSFFYIVPEVASTAAGVGVDGQTVLAVSSSYMLYALVPASLLVLPPLLGHLAAFGLNTTTDLPLPARWRPLCLAVWLPTCGLVKICLDATTVISMAASYIIVLVLVHMLAAVLQTMVVLTAGALLTLSMRSGAGGDVRQLSAASCRAAVQQHMVTSSRLGPFYLFFFSAICFGLMFYTFDVYLLIKDLGVFSAGLLIYVGTALGKNALLLWIRTNFKNCYYSKIIIKNLPSSCAAVYIGQSSFAAAATHRLRKILSPFLLIKVLFSTLKTVTTWSRG